MLNFIWFLLLVLMIVDGTTLLNSIDNAAYISSNMANALAYNGTCNQCICQAFFSNSSLNYQALNCYKNNKTCLLFSNYVLKSMIQINLNSTLIFKQVQSLQTTNQSKLILSTLKSNK
jgi:hypothetical protein